MRPVSCRCGPSMRWPAPPVPAALPACSIGASCSQGPVPGGRRSAAATASRPWRPWRIRRGPCQHGHHLPGDGRTGAAQVYTALFCAEGGKLRRLAEDQAIALADWATQLRTYAQPIWLVGDGAALAAESLAGAGLSLHLAPEHLRQQRAAGVALAALAEGTVQDAAYITPNYLRLPQAERERLARMKDKKE